MKILRISEEDNALQANSLARKFRVKIMQRIGTIELPSRRMENIDVSENLEQVIDSLLSALSDKVRPGIF
jgi:hypothetical protein